MDFFSKVDQILRLNYLNSCQEKPLEGDITFFNQIFQKGFFLSGSFSRRSYFRCKFSTKKTQRNASNLPSGFKNIIFQMNVIQTSFPKNKKFSLCNIHKQPTRSVLKEKSENMQQIYRKTPMPKCDFNKVALQLY